MLKEKCQDARSFMFTGSTRASSLHIRTYNEISQNLSYFLHCPAKSSTSPFFFVVSIEQHLILFSRFVTPSVYPAHSDTRVLAHPFSYFASVQQHTLPSCSHPHEHVSLLDHPIVTCCTIYFFDLSTNFNSIFKTLSSGCLRSFF